MNELDTLIARYLKLASTRGVSASNPVRFVLNSEDKPFVLIVGYLEPTFVELPYNVLWLNCNPGSSEFQQILRRLSHVSDGQHRGSWQRVVSIPDMYSIDQFYRKVAEGAVDMDVDPSDMAIPRATTTSVGLVTLLDQSADAVAVSDSDPRMSDPRYPNYHEHGDVPRRRIRLNSSSFVDVGASKVPEKNAVIVITGKDSALASRYIGEWRVPTADMVDWESPRLLALRVSLPGSNSYMRDASSIQMVCVAEYEDHIDQAPTDVVWSIQQNPYNVTIGEASGIVSAPDLDLDVTLTVTARKQDPVYKTWVEGTYSLRIKNITVEVTLSSIRIVGPTEIQGARSATYSLVGTYSDGSQSALVPSSFLSSQPSTLAVSGVVATAAKINADTVVALNATYGSLNATLNVTVKAYLPQSLEISGLSTIDAGATQGYLFTVTYTNGDTAQVTPAVFNSPSNRLTISGKSVTALTVPYDTDTTLAATYSENGATVNAVFALRIKYVAPLLIPKSLTINGSTSVNEGTSATYTCTVTYTDGTTATVTPSSFTSSNSAVFSVSGLTGTAAQVSADNNVTLTAAYTENGTSVTGTLPITIVDTTVLSSLAISGASSVQEGASSTYTVTATYSDGSTKSVTPATFASSNTAVLSVSGLTVTGAQVSADTAVTLTATYTDKGVTKTATKAVTVTNVAPTISSIAIIGAASVNEQSTSQYTAVYNMSDGTTQSATGLTWAMVQGSSYASINSSSGLLTSNSVSADQAVMIRVTDASSRTTTKTVTVLNTVTVAPTSVSISGAVQVTEGSTSQYTADVSFSDGTYRQVTSSEVNSWSITAGGTYCSISSTGLLTATTVSADQAATISLSVTVDGVTLTDTHAITIKDIPVTVVGAIIEGAASPSEGTSEQYTAKISLSDGTKVSPTSITSWTITQGSAKATVNSSGLVTYGLTAVNTAITIQVVAVYGGQSYTGTLAVTLVNTGNKVISTALTGPTSINETAVGTYSLTLTLEDGTTASIKAIALTVLSGGSYATATGATLTAGIVSADKTVSIQGTGTYGGSNYSATLTVTIKDVPVVLSSVTISGAASVPEGTTSQYTATAVYSDGTTANVTNTATWSITNNGGMTGFTLSKGLVTAPQVTADAYATIAVSFTSGSVTKTSSYTLKVANAVATGYGPRFGIVSKVTALANFNDAFMQSLTTTLTGGAEDIISLPSGSSTSANGKFGYVAYPKTLGYAYVRLKEASGYGFAGSWDGAMEFDDFNFVGAAEVTIGGVGYYIYRNDFPFESNAYNFSFTYGSSNTLSGQP
jgi:hypothetical protein